MPKRLVLLILIILLSPSPEYTRAATNDLLPDLRMAPLRDTQIERTSTGRRLLRFTAEILNLGEGPFEVGGSRASTGTPLMTNVRQRIFLSGGGFREASTPATMSFAADGHNHWHINNLERYELIPLGGNIQAGIGVKSGFCFFDNHHESPAFANSPAQSQYIECGTPQSLSVTMGLSLGWGDIYFWDLPDQYIDVTNLSPGEYTLTATADPDNWFSELDETNNQYTITVTLPPEWHVYVPQVAKG